MAWLMLACYRYRSSLCSRPPSLYGCCPPPSRLYASFAEEQQHPPKSLSIENLLTELQSYWGQVKGSGETD
ncbi:hypothetical protein EON65_36315, partial [archaeon]